MKIVYKKGKYRKYNFFDWVKGNILEICCGAMFIGIVYVSYLIVKML